MGAGKDDLEVEGSAADGSGVVGAKAVTVGVEPAGTDAVVAGAAGPDTAGTVGMLATDEA